MNGSTGKRNGSSDSTSDSSDLKNMDPLDKARAKLQEAREANNLLLDAADFDEDTGRHEVTVNLNQPSTPQPSSPQIEVSQPEPSVLKIAFTAVNRLKGWPLAFAIAVAVAAVLRWYGKL
jgi:hypothetical protein